MITEVYVDQSGNTFVAIDYPVNDVFKLDPGWRFQCRLVVGAGIEVVAVDPHGNRTLLVPAIPPTH